EEFGDEIRRFGRECFLEGAGGFFGGLFGGGGDFGLASAHTGGEVAHDGVAPVAQAGRASRDARVDLADDLFGGDAQSGAGAGGEEVADERVPGFVADAAEDRRDVLERLQRFTGGTAHAFAHG